MYIFLAGFMALLTIINVARGEYLLAGFTASCCLLDLAMAKHQDKSNDV